MQHQHRDRVVSRDLMCFNDDSKLSPAAAMTSSNESEVGTPPPPKKVVARYQNVSLASSPSAAASDMTRDAESNRENVFQLQDKKGESQVEAATVTTFNNKPSIKEDMASLVLSGGCVMSDSTNWRPQPAIPPAMIVHHHHHHFYPVPSSSSPPAPPPVVRFPPPPPPPVPEVSHTYGNLSHVHRVLSLNKQMLEECGWYYGSINWAQSTELLTKTTEGTFLVRDSADSRFLYSLSVQRKPQDGPTSVRIHFSQGKFRLDADEAIEHLMPTFDSVLDLVKHYCQLSETETGGSKDCAKSHVWIDNTGQLYSPICLRKPLLKEVPSLAHCARLAVHQSLKSQDKLRDLHLPFTITRYLNDYPHVM